MSENNPGDGSESVDQYDLNEEDDQDDDINDIDMNMNMNNDIASASGARAMFFEKVSSQHF